MEIKKELTIENSRNRNEKKLKNHSQITIVEFKNGHQNTSLTQDIQRATNMQRKAIT